MILSRPRSKVQEERRGGASREVPQTDSVDGALSAHAGAGFEDILIAHLESLWAVALRLCKNNMQDAEDLLQDSVLRAFRARASLETVEYPFAWLRRTLVNTFLNRVRDDKRWQARLDLTAVENTAAAGEYDGTPDALIDALKADVWDDDIMSALDALPDTHRTMLLLADIEGYSHDELAVMFGIAKGTVSSRVFRARKKLAEQLEEYAIARGYVTRPKLAAERDAMIKAMGECPDARREALANDPNRK